MPSLLKFYVFLIPSYSASEIWQNKGKRKKNIKLKNIITVSETELLS